jgi:osmotically-inducible protein OsmY
MTKKTDEQLEQAVRYELRHDTRVADMDVGVDVENGVVTLTGTVSSWGKRLAAQDAAHRVAGVLDVANDIEVGVPGNAKRSDPEIAQAVREALQWDVLVPDERIRSTVSKGEVVLEGEVPFLRQSEDAANSIRNLTGVKSVINRIKVVPPSITPPDLRHAIRAALERQADREADRIELDIDDGRVTVSGVVHSWREREAVLGAVKGTAGVRAVISDLHLQPYST